MKFKLWERWKNGLVERFSWSVGVDLGTVNSWWMMPGKGVLWNDPSVVARRKKKKYYGMMAPNKSGGQIVAFGKQAKMMIGKEPAQLEIVYPLRNGVIADFEVTKEYIARYLELLGETPSRFPKLMKPRVVVGVPSGVTAVERRAVKVAFLEAGAGEVFLADEALLAAVGAGMPVESSAGMLVVDIGGGTTEIALVSLGGVVLSRCLPVAGEEMDQAVANFVKMKYGLLIGEPTAERVKIELGSVRKISKEEKVMVVRGRALDGGLPKSVRVNAEEVREALAPIVQKIVKELVALIEESPPELLGDVVKNGIALAGGGALLEGMAEMVEEETKMGAWVVPEPMGAVARGCQRLLEERELLEGVVFKGFSK